jgi:hypothetical protein
VAEEPGAAEFSMTREDIMKTETDKKAIRRTLRAIGIAVLLSSGFAPWGNHLGKIAGHYPGWGSFGGSYNDVVLITPLVLQTVFLATLFAVIVNIRWWPKSWWPRRKNRKRPSVTNPHS